jgi:putative membrane protein
MRERGFDAMLLYLIVSWLLGALSLMIVAYVVPGFVVQSFGAAMVAALVIGLINSTLGVLLKVLTLPLTVVTFGLFLFVINAFILRMASGLVGGFTVDSGAALIGAIVLALVSTVLRHVVFA